MKHSTITRVARALVITAMGVITVAVCVGFLYLSYSWQMASYNVYVTCNPKSGISRIEWFLGFRPAENDCWH